MAGYAVADVSQGGQTRVQNMDTGDCDSMDWDFDIYFSLDFYYLNHFLIPAKVSRIFHSIVDFLVSDWVLDDIFLDLIDVIVHG